MRRGCGGQWTKMPATMTKREVDGYDPVELAAHDARELAAYTLPRRE